MVLGAGSACMQVLENLCTVFRNVPNSAHPLTRDQPVLCGLCPCGLNRASWSVRLRSACSCVWLPLQIDLFDCISLLNAGATAQAFLKRDPFLFLSANKFRSLSIGQGMGEQAQQLVEAGCQRGFWIMLQNCHLLPAWLTTLAKLIQGLRELPRTSATTRSCS